MSRVNVYLPDDLAAAAREAGLNLSAVTQEAVRRVLAARSTDAWLATIVPVESTATHDDVIEALDGAREEPPTRHA